MIGGLLRPNKETYRDNLYELVLNTITDGRNQIKKKDRTQFYCIFLMNLISHDVYSTLNCHSVKFDVGYIIIRL
jgi:hypothetical protein